MQIAYAIGHFKTANDLNTLSESWKIKWNTTTTTKKPPDVQKLLFLFKLTNEWIFSNHLFVKLLNYGERHNNIALHNLIGFNTKPSFFFYLQILQIRNSSYIMRFTKFIHFGWLKLVLYIWILVYSHILWWYGREGLLIPLKLFGSLDPIHKSLPTQYDLILYKYLFYINNSFISIDTIFK